MDDLPDLPVKIWIKVAQLETALRVAKCDALRWERIASDRLDLLTAHSEVAGGAVVCSHCGFRHHINFEAGPDNPA